MKLVIVESPTKAKTIGRFLGEGYEIKASMGHVMDLPKSTLGVDVEKDFAPDFEMVKDKSKIIAEIKSSAKRAENIVLATDPDREGEAIASHIKDMLSSSEKLKVKSEKFQRVVFHEITKEAIDEAFANPRSINENLVDAQTARRVLDRLVGYKLSPLLWQKVRRGLSAGRVQSIALRLIVEREKEIEKFKKEKYYTITAVMAKSKLKSQNSKLEETEFELVEINGEKIEEQEVFELYDGQYKVTKTTIKNQESAEEILKDIKNEKFKVASVLQKEARRSPQPPYTTSTLQQDASRRFGFSGKRTMTIAQKLYEEGYITYHRTDSVIISTSAQSAIISYIVGQLGQKYVPDKPRFYTTKQKLAQEAHEAIRPTDAKREAVKVRAEMGMDFGKIYELIWIRALASQMSDAIIEQTTVLANSNLNKYTFKANGSVLVFDGFLKLNPQALDDRRLPDFAEGEELSLVEVKDEEHETASPPRYNDASIIKILEEKGIGRPSTYATIISTIIDRRYVEKDPPTGGGRFIPTTVGVAVNDFLVANFSTIDDIPFTAEMEDQLDEIARGVKKWVPVIRDFYKPFEEKLADVKDVARVKIEVEETDEKCPECNANLVIRMGRFGKFLSCSTFPKCKFSKAFVIETDFKCPKDGGKIILKKTRKGRTFYGCSNYPACDYASWKLEDIKKVT